MAVSQSYNIILGLGIVFAFSPRLNMGLLSDYKICVDSECQSKMSRVQAIRDHHGKDCRYLSFRQGDTIFVYHKLTGKREDLWAGSIDKQFGYFPKDAVRQEQLYATVEKIVETQESDFFCMDEFGYPIDSSHLDNDDDNEDVDRTQNQEPETTQTAPSLDNENAESPSASEDVSTESAESAQEAEGCTQEEPDKNTNPDDDAAGTQEGAQEDPAASKEQGGSTSSPWHGSSMTGWLGLTKEEEPANVAEREKGDAREEPQAEASSFTSSMTEWLGMGGDGGTTDTDVKEREEEGENAESFTSTMTGWLGFGGEKETANPAEKEEEEEERKEDEEQEPAETFRSRRMSLDLEGSQLHEEEKKETGTMDWLGSGLSNTLGFGWTNQESERTESQVQETTEEEEQPASGSWYDLGIGDILGYNKDKIDESTGSGFQEPENDETLDRQTGSERVDTSQLQPTLTEEVRTETIHESKMVEMTEDQNAHSETAPGTTEPITADSDNNSTGVSDRSKSSDLPGSAAAEAVGGKSSTPDSFHQIGSKEDDKEDAVIDYRTENTVLVGELSAEIEGKDHQTSKAIKHEGDDNDRHTREEEEIKTVSETDQDLLTQSHIDVLTNLSSVDSTGRSESGVEEDKTENLVGESDEIQSHIDESADLPVNISAREDEHDEGVNNEEADGLHRDITETEGSAEHVIVGSVDGESMVENHNQIFNEHETLERIGSVADQGSVSPDKQLNANQGEEDAQEQKDTVKDTEIDNLQSVTTITTGIEKYALNESGPTSFKDSDTETEMEEEDEMRTEELKKEQKQMEFEEEEEIRAQEEHQEVDEEKQDKVKESKEEEKQQEVKEISDEGKLLESEELMEEKTQLDIKEIKEVGIQEEFGESKERQEEEATQDEMEELKEEEKSQEVKEISEIENPVGLEEFKEEVEEIKDEGNQKEFGESKEEERQEEEKVTQDETEELKEEEKRGKVEDEQHPIEEIEEELQRVVEESKEREQTEEFKLLEEGSEKEKKDCEEERVKLSHFEPEIENMNRPDSESKEKETQDEESVETSSQTDERRTENPQVEEAEKEEENKQKESLHEVQDAKENVEGERRKKEEEGSEEQFVRARDGKDSTNKFSKEEGDVVAGNPNPESNMTEESQTLSLKGTERDDDRQQGGGVKEDKRHDDAEADLNVLGLNQTENMEYTNNDLLHSVEGKEVSSSQTTEVKEKIPELTGDKVLYQEINVEETGSKELSHEDKIETKNGDYNEEERELNMKHDDEKLSDYADVKVTNQNTVGTELMTDGKILPGEAFEAQAVISEETAQHSTGSPLQSDSTDDSEAESGGAFGLFKNAFSYFRQTPTAETKESTDTAQSLDSSTLETSTTLTPEEEPDTATDSSQVYVQDLLTDTFDSLSHKQPSPSLLQTPYSHPSSIPLNAETPSQTKTLSRFYKNLLAFISADDIDILTDLFGRHKLQFLDDVLGSSETMTGDPDTADSIVLDVERLLHHHMEMLVAPSKRLQDASQEDKEKTKTLLSLQKLEMLLAKVRETFSTGKPDTSNTSHQADGSCVGESCSTPSKDKEMYDELQKVGDSSVGLDTNTPKDEWMGRDKQSDKKIGGGTEEERVTKKEERDIEPGPPKKQEGVIQQTLDFVQKIAEDSSTHVHAARELLIWLTVQVVSALPDDIRPGPDLYGLPWEPVIVSSLVGLVTMLLFTCRCYSSVKSRFYRSKERWMAEQVAQLLDEKCKVLETLSKCQQEYDDLEGSLRDSGVLAQTQKTEELEVKARQMGHDKKELERDLKQLKDQLDQQKEHRKEQERRIAVLEESMETSEEETKDLHSQEEQAQTTLKVYNMNSERLQRNMETAGEENKFLQESNAQLRQQVEGWAERVSELEEEISRCEVSHSGMLQDVTNKDERIWSLTDRLLRMKAWDPDMEEEGGQEEGEQETSNGTARRREENGRGDKTDTQGHLQKVQKLIYAAKLNADLKSVDEDKDRAFAKLNDEIKAKEDLEVSIKELENEKLSLQSDSEHYSDQVQRLQQKLNIMTEMYQEKELKLHRLLTVEEKERMQKEERLNKADKNIALAMEELNNYRQRAEEMEEELEKSKQSYQTQISAHEKKAHNNWLAARAAERELADIRRENALFRQKLTDTQFKLDALDKDPYALDSLARPLPFRAERSPYGPSPLGRPASETRAFLSPPTLMDGPPARLSPRVPRGPMDPPGGPGDMERSGGPHSDSGSISPTWERDRRGPPPGPPGPLGHPGYMFSDPGGPMYRRAPPPPGAMGPFPTPGPFPPGPLPPRGLPPGPFHPADMTDGSFRENSFGPGEMEHRESGPGDRRTPPEAESRTGGPLLPGHPMGPMDGPFPRRPPYGPPPPDFYPPRIPGGPPMRPMWALPPPGMMFPPRFPPGGPLPPHPLQAPMMRPPLPDGLPPPSMGPLPPRHALPSPPHSQSPEQHTPSPEDAI